MKFDRLGAILGLMVMLGGLLYSYAQQMERLNRLCQDVLELKSQQNEIMKAIGGMEHDRWLREHPR